MPTYEMELQRKVTQQAYVVVEAANESEAIDMAKSMKENLTWSATDVDFDTPEITGVY